MADLKWIGGTSSDSTNVNNWIDLSTGSAPSSVGAGDVLNFGDASIRDCELNQTSLGIIITDFPFVADGRKLVFTQGTLQVVHVNLAHGQIIKFTQSSTTVTFAGTHGTAAPYHDHPLILNGNVTYDTGGNAKTTVTFIMKNGNSSAAHLTDGELPNVTLDGKFTWDAPHEDVTAARDPDATFSESNCCKLTITSSATFDNSPITYSFTSTQKHVRVTGQGSSSGQHFACAAAICDFSNAKLTIDAKNSQQMPCTNDVTNFGTSTDFIALLEDVVVGNDAGNGNKNIIPEGLTLECASLEIQSGSYLYGGGTNLQTSAKSHIHVIEKPTIRGTWNFEETTDGIYSSIGGVSSASIHTLKSDTVHILGKLTVDGLIDPTGLELTPVGSNPGGTTANTLWLNSGDSNKLYHGSSEVSGGSSSLDFCHWDDIDAEITVSNVGSNELIDNWTYSSGSTAIRDAMSSGVWTCTSALAGTYLVISKIQFGSGTLSETGGVNYKLQNLNYHNAGGGTPSSGTLHNFARHMNSDFYSGYCIETQFMLTIANTDTFGVYGKIATSSGTGNYKIKNPGNGSTSLTMIKIA
ncbi:MAG: hypothetical protein CMC15_14900 [Flavobacteriaceae bacterium]|nr:hypothetical protein [Flavobacteriaceae bacterium]|tara:strand:+ start:139 stop:1878 length:1740 start_codon:yes stop_codon:yes gene_type:complete